MNATQRFAHSSAIVTGSARGIGREIALRLACDGAHVVVSDLDEHGASEVAAEIEKEGGFAQALAGDVTDLEYQTQMIVAAQQMAPLKMAVNNAGILGPTAAIPEYSVESWRKVIEVNLNAVFYGLRAQLPAIASSGGGAIVNIASIVGSVGFAEFGAYVSSKHAVVGLTKCAAWEYGTKGVRVNSVGPGFVRTPMVEGPFPEEALHALESEHAFNRLAHPAEIANAVAFLLSDEASFISGSYHPVDAGYTAR